MGEIKFKAWHPDLGISESFGLSGCPVWNRGGHARHVPYWSEASRIMQYTGLKDVDGKEIYEGDIVEFGYHGGRILAVVRYTAETAAFRAYRCSDIGDADSYILGHEFLENLVKIGNIHDNPELLRGENGENQP